MPQLVSLMYSRNISGRALFPGELLIELLQNLNRTINNKLLYLLRQPNPQPVSYGFYLEYHDEKVYLKVGDMSIAITCFSEINIMIYIAYCLSVQLYGDTEYAL